MTTANLPARGEALEHPFAEGARDAIDPDLRHRLISDAAYRRYVARNYEAGFELDDWLDAEAEVDHLATDVPLAAGDEA